MFQPSMRNSHLRYIMSLSNHSMFTAFFTMMGGYKYLPDSTKLSKYLDMVIITDFNFLRAMLNGRIILTIPNQYREFLPISEDTLAYIKNGQGTIKHSNDDRENLRWKYGIPNVVGYGTRWEITGKDEQIVNWGNTIAVFNNNCPIGIDFGGGLESLIKAKAGLSHLIYANNYSSDFMQIFCNQEKNKEKIVDCITAIICILTAKPKLSARDNMLLVKYSKFIIAIAIIENISNDILMQLIESLLGTFEIENNKIKEDILNLLNCTRRNFVSLLKSKQIYKAIDIFNKYYEPGLESWATQTKVQSNSLQKYFTNLSEIELQALKQLREKQKDDSAIFILKKRRKINDKTEKAE